MPQEFCEICNKMWRTGRWFEDWTSSAFIPIHEKGSTKRCQNYRVISLISHTSKIFLIIASQRLSYLKHQINPSKHTLSDAEGSDI